MRVPIGLVVVVAADAATTIAAACISDASIFVRGRALLQAVLLIMGTAWLARKGRRRPLCVAVAIGALSSLIHLDVGLVFSGAEFYFLRNTNARSRVRSNDARQETGRRDGDGPGGARGRPISP